MFDEIDSVKGVKWTISMNSLIGPAVPDSMIPNDIKEMLQSDDYELHLYARNMNQQRRKSIHRLHRSIRL